MSLTSVLSTYRTSGRHRLHNQQPNDPFPEKSFKLIAAGAFALLGFIGISKSVEAVAYAPEPPLQTHIENGLPTFGRNDIVRYGEQVLDEGLNTLASGEGAAGVIAVGGALAVGAMLRESRRRQAEEAQDEDYGNAIFEPLAATEYSIPSMPGDLAHLSRGSFSGAL